MNFAAELTRSLPGLQLSGYLPGRQQLNNQLNLLCIHSTQVYMHMYVCICIYDISLYVCMFGDERNCCIFASDTLGGDYWSISMSIITGRKFVNEN